MFVSHKKAKWQHNKSLGITMTAVYDSRDMTDVVASVGSIVFDTIR